MTNMLHVTIFFKKLLYISPVQKQINSQMSTTTRTSPVYCLAKKFRFAFMNPSLIYLHHHLISSTIEVWHLVVQQQQHNLYLYLL